MDSDQRSARRVVARWRSRSLALAVALAGAALPPAAAAAAEPAPVPPEPTEVEKQNARGLMDQGVDRERARDHEGALKYYQAAHALVRLPMTGMAVARVQEKLGMYAEALESAAEVKALPVRPDETPAYARARAEADAMIARLRERTPAAHGGAGGAEGAQPPPADAAGGAVPGAGDAGEGSAVPALAWVGFGVGVAGLLVGGITGVVTLSRASELEAECATSGCDQSEIDAANVTANISNVGFAVGGVGIGVGVVALILSGGREPAAAAAGPRIQVAPWAGPGVSVTGVF